MVAPITSFLHHLSSVGAQAFSDPSKVFRFQSGLYMDHSRTLTEFSWSHSFDILAVWWLTAFRSCWKMNCRPSLRSIALWSKFSSRMCLFIATVISPKILTSLLVPAAENNIPTEWCCHHAYMMPRNLTKECSWLSCQTRDFVSHGQSPSGVFWQTSDRLPRAFNEGLTSVWPLYQTRLSVPRDNPVL